MSRRWRIIFLAAALALPAAWWLRPAGSRAVPGGEAKAQPAIRTSRLVQAGARLYAEVCVYCHGAAGDGFGLNSPNLAQPPRDHTDAAYMSSLSDDNLLAVIKFGGAARGKSPLMPGWGGRFSDRELAALAAHVRTLSGRPR
ncbi:MAG: cytochrome c [Acidobacteriota bacterium]